jgi:hypothetical protein
MEKQESKRRFPTFPQPRRLRTITTYGIRILRARSWSPGLDEAAIAAGFRFIGEQFPALNGYRFVPLVTEKLCLRCSLDITFLRPEESGMLYESGDLDGRVKTVFDALRMPKIGELRADDIPQDGETPFFVLLEDDKLISEVRINADQLLMVPLEKEIKPNDVFMAIHVKLQVTQPIQFGWVF